MLRVGPFGPALGALLAGRGGEGEGLQVQSGKWDSSNWSCFPLQFPTWRKTPPQRPLAFCVVRQRHEGRSLKGETGSVRTYLHFSEIHL